jgi:hypothetical protein
VSQSVPDRFATPRTVVPSLSQGTEEVVRSEELALLSRPPRGRSGVDKDGQPYEVYLPPTEAPAQAMWVVGFDGHPVLRSARPRMVLARECSIASHRPGWTAGCQWWGEDRSAAKRAPDHSQRRAPRGALIN